MSFLKELGSEQRTKALRDLSTTPPEDDHWLWWYIDTFYNVRVPYQKVCPEHTPPFQVLADAYFARYPVIVLKGSRGLAAKSFLLAILGNLRASLHGHWVTILGGSGAQSKNVQQYMKGEHPRAKGKIWDAPFAPRHLIQSKTGTEIRFTNQGLIMALNASQGQARGPHPQLLEMDEVDEMDEGIFRAALGQAMGIDEDGEFVDDLHSKANTIISSTHQNDGGTMDLALAMAAEKGWPVYEVCYRENLQSNGGWLSDTEVARKKDTMSDEDWEVEVELQEPNPEGKVFTREQLEILFDEDWGEYKDEMGFEYEIIPPEAPGTYVHGADWGKRLHYTCITTFRESISGPDQLAAWTYMKRRSWPYVIGRYNERVNLYGGKGAHDETGIGDVIGDFLDPSLKTEGVQFSDRMKIMSIFSGFIGACQAGDEITMAKIPRLYQVFRSLTNDQVFYRGHPPDEFVAAALAYSKTEKAKRARKRKKSGLQMGRA